MLSREENELVTRVGPGHADGQRDAHVLDPRAARRSEIAEPDGPPVPASACWARTWWRSATPRAASG